MSEEENSLRKVSSLITEAKRQKIANFDDGLLYNCFEPLSGPPETQFAQSRTRSLAIASRIRNIEFQKYQGEHKDQENDEENESEYEDPEIVTEIFKFYGGTDEDDPEAILPDLKINVDQFEGDQLMIKIKSGTGKIESSCLESNLPDMIKTKREEQYIPLINRSEALRFKAIAFLTSDVFPWHKKSYTLNIPGYGEVLIKD